MATSTGPSEVVTDAGRAYLKALGNKEGPHVLAAEWIGTALADWLGLRTFSVAKLIVEGVDEIPLGHGKRADPGTAIAIRAEGGSSWSGTAEELRATENASDVGRLIVLDTWLLNCDRHPPDLTTRKPNYENVFLSTEGAREGKFVITAMDHTHCFSCGRDITPRVARIDYQKDDRIYGRFPEFDEFLDVNVVNDAVTRLESLDTRLVKGLVEEIAEDWQITSDARQALVALIISRGDYVTKTIRQKLFQ